MCGDASRTGSITRKTSLLAALCRDNLFPMTQSSFYLGWLKSRLIYDLVPGRRRRMQRFYAAFLRAGDLCFDVGAHTGSRAAVLASLGCEVVAIEPHPFLAGKLGQRFAKTGNLLVRQIAVSDTTGQATLHSSPRYLTVSSLKSAWTDSLRKVRPHNIRFTEEVVVETRSLDDLIEEHGVPRYCKLDIEGMDVVVLRTLSQPIEVISFEHLPGMIADTVEAVAALHDLAEYRFNHFPRESHVFQLAEPVAGDALIESLQASAAVRSASDVFAFRVAVENRANH